MCIFTPEKSSFWIRKEEKKKKAITKELQEEVLS